MTPTAAGDLDERIAQTASAFRAYCTSRKHAVTGDDRVTEPVAAELLGFAVATLQKRRLAGNAPRYFRLTAHPTYRLADLAAWVESRSRIPD